MDIMNFLSGRPSLPNNNRLAAARLQHLKKRLKYTQIYCDHYKAFMEKIINKGDSEPAPVIPEGETVWYIHTMGVPLSETR